MGYEVKENLVIPTLRTEEGKEVFFKVLEPMQSGRTFEEGKPAATIVRIIQCDNNGKSNGEIMELPLNKAVKDAFESLIAAKKSYVGKFFRLMKREKKEGKGGRQFRYVDFQEVVFK